MPKLIIKNFGGINEAEFEGAELTITAGNNNSDKSLIHKVFYCLLCEARNLSE